MVKYRFELKVAGSPNSYPYILDLNLAQENNPEQIFNQEIRQSMQNNLQNQSSCKISEPNLKKIINAWIEDIKEGYRTTTLTLDLPLLAADKFNYFQESGCQEIPTPIRPTLAGIEPLIGAFPRLNF